MKKKVLKKKKSKKIERVMHEFKEGDLHSGNEQGPTVDNPKQALAIAMSEARKVGAQMSKRMKKKKEKKK